MVPQPYVEKNFRLAQAAIEEDLQMPQPDPDGRIQTLNKKGAMSPKLDPISSEFVGETANPGVKSLEIGAGYGLSCIKALELGASDCWVNDLEEKHLMVLARRLFDLDPNYLSRVNLVAGSFPDAVKLPENHFDVCLIARVLHFMNPEEAVRTLQGVHSVLKPGGKIYAVMLSPYVRGFASYIPKFEQRVRDGEPFPGWVENLIDIADRAVVPESALKNMDRKPFHFFDIRTASSLFEKAGFRVIQTREMPLAYESDIWQLDGRENVGVIAQKP